MNRLDKTFIKLREQSQKAFVAYITAGDPNLQSTMKIMQMFVQSGVDVIELGVPFSDPIGDGPVNQAAAMRGIKSGTTLESVLDLVKRFRVQFETPVVIFSYLNPIVQVGVDRFSKKSYDAGVDGVLTVDGPFDMCQDIAKALTKKGIHSIYLAAPTTSDDRLKQIVNNCGGFVYYVSSLGVTGQRSSFEKDLSKRVAAVKALSTKPVCVGFGISNPTTARKISKFSDGIVVGSAFVKIIQDNNGSARNMLERLADFTKVMVKSIKK